MKKIHMILGILLISISAAMAVDFDSDNIPTALEILSNTNPINSDSNGDGIMDGNLVNSRSGGSSQIPEFPTVALPVIAVIGLLFIFQRRKGK